MNDEFRFRSYERKFVVQLENPTVPDSKGFPIRFTKVGYVNSPVYRDTLKWYLDELESFHRNLGIEVKIVGPRGAVRNVRKGVPVRYTPPLEKKRKKKRNSKTVVIPEFAPRNAEEDEDGEKT